MEIEKQAEFGEMIDLHYLLRIAYNGQENIKSHLSSKIKIMSGIDNILSFLTMIFNRTHFKRGGF